MLVFLLAGLLLPDRRLALVLLAVGLTLGSLVAILTLLGRRETARDRSEVDQIARFVEHDASPSFGTDAEGQILHQNRAATDRFGRDLGATLARRLGDLFASPSAVLYRLQSRAVAVGSAREDVVTRRGHVRLSVHLIGEGNFLWRLEEMTDRSASARGAETLCLPMLTSSRTGTILFMNEAMRHLAGGRLKTLDDLFPRLPLVSGQETEVRGAAGLLRCIVADLEGSGGRREVFLLPVGLGPVGAPPDPAGFESIPVALMQLGPLGEIRAANREARELLHLGPDEDVRLGDLVEGPGRPLLDWLADGIAGRCKGRPEVLRGRRGGGDPFLHMTLRPAPDPEAGDIGLVAVLTDATAFKSLEAQVLQSQKMQAVGQLAGGVAHDFNNMLTAIAGHCDLLLMRHDPGDPDFADLQQIRQNTNRAASVVGQLLAFSRKQTLMPEVLEIDDLLGEVTHLLNRLVGERVTLRFASDPDLPPIRADRRQLEQVIVNLVVNARDAMPKGGEIRIATETVDLPAQTRRDRTVLPPGRYAVIRVCDQGTGIAPENLNRIFEPFFTTKRPGEGTGLGLSTAYGIVKQTGGFIFADSRPGQGAEFSLWFTAYDPRDRRPNPRTPAQRSAGRQGRVGMSGPTAGATIPSATFVVDGRDEQAAPASAPLLSPPHASPFASFARSRSPAEPASEAGDPSAAAPRAGVDDPACSRTGAPAIIPIAPDASDARGAVLRRAPAILPTDPPGDAGDSFADQWAGRTAQPGNGAGHVRGTGSAPGLSASPPPSARADASSPSGTDGDDTSDPMDSAETVEHGLSDTSSNKVAQDTAQARPDSIAPSASPLPDTDEAIETLLARISARSAAGQAAGQEEGGPAPTAPKALVAKRVDAATAPSRQHTASAAPAGAVATAGRHPAGQTAELPPPASPPAEDPVVLLVEDEAPVRAFASRALRLHGFSVLEAASAEDALELLRDPGLRVDVFLTDVVMPGLDGPGWVREALVTRPGVPVVFMSGYAEDALAEARMEIEGAQFLAKPFTLADLTRTVTALVT